MALGILLVTFAGVMLFIAFHNLPTTVQDLGGLLAYIAAGVQSGAAQDTGAPGFGPATSSAAGGSNDVSAVGGTVAGIQGTALGVSAPGATPSGALTGG